MIWWYSCFDLNSHSYTKRLQFSVQKLRGKNRNIHRGKKTQQARKLRLVKKVCQLNENMAVITFPYPFLWFESLCEVWSKSQGQQQWAKSLMSQQKLNKLPTVLTISYIESDRSGTKIRFWTVNRTKQGMKTRQATLIEKIIGTVKYDNIFSIFQWQLVPAFLKNDSRLNKSFTNSHYLHTKGAGALLQRTRALFSMTSLSWAAAWATAVELLRFSGSLCGQSTAKLNLTCKYSDLHGTHPMAFWIQM